MDVSSAPSLMRALFYAIPAQTARTPRPTLCLLILPFRCSLLAAALCVPQNGSALDHLKRTQVYVTHHSDMRLSGAFMIFLFPSRLSFSNVLTTNASLLGISSQCSRTELHVYIMKRRLNDVFGTAATHTDNVDLVGSSEALA